MKKLLFLLLLIPFLGTSQGTFTAPVGYNTGAPTAAPSGVGTRWRFDLLTGKKYTWNPDAVAWDEDARGIDQISGCSAPMYTPGYNQSTFAVNSCSPTPELYQYTGSSWALLNPGGSYTAGTGIDINGSNEISNTLPDQTVVLNEGAGIDVTGTYPNFTLASTITQGLTSLNSQTGTTQAFATGTAGTDFGISSATNTHTFNLPDASATNRGALTSANWTTFNNKVGGSGTTNYIPKFTGSGTLGNSIMYETATGIGINTISPTGALDVRIGSLGARFIHSAPTGGATAGGIAIINNSSDEAGQSTASILGTNSAVWASAAQGISFKNHTREINVGSNINFGALLGVNEAWLGVSGVQAVEDGLIVTAASSNVNLTALKYASSPHPALNVSAREISLRTKSTAAWPDGAYGTVYGSVALFLSGTQQAGVNTASPASQMDVNGANGYQQLRLRTTYTPTSSADALGSTGDTAWDANYIYIKTASGWKRSALSTF